MTSHRILLGTILPLLLTGCLGYEIATANDAPQESLQETFDRVKGAVVVIRTTERRVKPQMKPTRSRSEETSGRFTTVDGIGSGFIIRNESPALIVTAAHVVQNADQVAVELSTGRRVPAEVQASSPAADLALLKLDRGLSAVEPIHMANSDHTNVGEQVFVIGAPHGLAHTLTVGYVSARRKSPLLTDGISPVELIQTDAAINQGNSGGPLLNRKGEAVGVVSHILTKSGGFEGMGFAVATSLAKRLLLEDPSPWSGLSGALVSGDLATIFNIPQPAGLLIERVARNSPAERLGLQAGSLPITVAGKQLVAGGDIILAVGGITVTTNPASQEEIRDYWRQLDKSSELELKILRRGKVYDLTRPISEL